MIRVAVHPPWESWLGDRMFSNADGCVYTTAFRRWRELAKPAGYILQTHDLVPPGKADVLWFMDLPRNRRAFKCATSNAGPCCPKVLQILESPLLFPAAFYENNRKYFDAVVSFEPSSDQSRHFGYSLPVSPDPTFEGSPFEDRKLATMVNTNRFEGWLATRKSGLVGLPGIGPYFSGWRLPAGFLLSPAKGELYSWRRSVASTFEHSAPEDLDIFGHGWNGEKVSWWGECSTRNKSWKFDAPDLSTAQRSSTKRLRLGQYRFVIASENFRGNLGYVSEKIFDAILGGSIPVYLGDEQILESIPKDCFIDARNFQKIPELISHLQSIRKPTWNRMRKAGCEFLRSREFLRFTDEDFAHRMVDILTRISSNQAGKH